jgi:6-pyruvoyltetrahydropterin/6-carboxytetrahydropterin synthase
MSAGRERWSIDLEKEYFKFSAAHFLIFPDGSAERLHGHNYRVHVRLSAELSRYGLVLDFKMVKPIVRAICDRLDEHWIVPGEHEELRVVRRSDGTAEITYREKRYVAPTGDVLVLPINNTSSENLAAWFGRELLAELARKFPDVLPTELEVSVEETAGQRGVWSRSSR